MNKQKLSTDRGIQVEMPNVSNVSGFLTFTMPIPSFGLEAEVSRTMKKICGN